MRVTDPRAIRAMAHPLRLDLLELLGGISPATAARCAQMLGVSQASASYHLRQLARYGLVEEGEPSGDQRERPWRIVSRHQILDTAPGPAVDQLAQVEVEREAGKILDFIDRRAGETGPWRDASFQIGGTLPLTPGEVATVQEQLEAVMRPYIARLDTDAPAPPPGGRWVRFFLAATPYPDLEES
jgi:DNA-binding transcriptional ArsR family regulator